MPSPIVNFGYTGDQLLINFVNLTLNTTVDSIYNWDFGDGNTSDLFEPIHTYETVGFYNVKLTVKNGLEEPESISDRLLNVYILPPNDIAYNIDKMVELYTPSGLEPNVIKTDRKSFFIVKWQLYLQPLIETPFTVASENVFNATFYPPLVNILISKLVVLDIITSNATEFLTKLLESGGSGNTVSDETATKEGTIKSIETGPTKIERYENKDISSNSEMLSNLGKTYTLMQRPGGLFDLMKADICQDADRVRVYLPMCGVMSGISIGLQIGKESRGSHHNANPFGVTNRML